MIYRVTATTASEARHDKRMCAAAESASVAVGVIDSGWDHSLESTRIVQGIALVDPEGERVLSVSRDTRDRNGHGTAVTDLLLQVAPEVDVVPIRVFGERLDTSPSVIVTALDWAVARGLKLVNLSLGTLRADAIVPLYAACERARHAGVVIVAAGRRTGDGWSFPAVFEPVIGVGHVPLSDPFAMVYRRGDALECGASAVGHRVRGLSAYLLRRGGTSLAAPIVTGHIARMLAAQGPMDVTEVREALAALYGGVARIKGDGAASQCFEAH